MTKNIKRQGIIWCVLAFAILSLASCSTQQKDQQLNEALVKYESKFWFKRSLAHVLLNRMNSEKSQIVWSTNFHTAAPVPLGAVGPQKYLDKLQGAIQNDSLGRVLKEAVNGRLNVILVIGDGMGNMHMALPIYKRYGEQNHEKTYFEKIMSEGACGYLYTATARGLVTGSAASGTAIASGTKTLMNMVGVDSLGNPLESALQLSTKKGYVTAIVSDAGITDATPAAFYAHSVNRNLESDIAFQLAKNNVDIVFGGGGSQFIPKGAKLSEFYKGNNYPDFTSARDDDFNLFEEFSQKGYQLCFSLDELNRISNPKVIGLFTGGGLPPTIEYGNNNASVPTLTQLATKTFELLQAKKQPSFAMIEAARIDWEAHDNDVVSVYKAVEEMNNVLKVAYQYYQQSPNNTLLIFTADHETGGLEIAYKKVGEDQIEKKMLKDGKVWENDTYPLLFGEFSKTLEGQDKTLSAIISHAETVEELKGELLNHASINLTMEEAELLFYAKHGYTKYKKE